MSAVDRRRWPCNGRVADIRLKGQVAVDRFVEPVRMQVVHPVADLLARPGGPRDRQVLFGETVAALETLDGYSFVEAGKDGYTGYLRADALGDRPEPTHRVRVAATHLYPEPSIKVTESCGLSMGARLCVTGTEGDFAATSAGYVFARHLVPLAEFESDPVAVAERLIGAPYLWGGNGYTGIDCSGLVQIACLACGIPCPGDSDMQQRELGVDLPSDAALRRGDLLFWKGHVAFVVDDTRILHANGHDMAVAYEDRQGAMDRIAAQGEGPVTGRKRLG